MEQSKEDLDKFYRACVELNRIRGRSLSFSGPSSPRQRPVGVGESQSNEDAFPASRSDFYGLPSHPPCIYRTGIPWPSPAPPDAQLRRREARTDFTHPLKRNWFAVGTKIYQYLDSSQISWTTIDPIRFAEEDGPAGPLYLWIGVTPGSLGVKEAKAAASGCKSILQEAGHPDVEIAFRESVFTPLAGPKLLGPLSTKGKQDDTDNQRSPFAPLLGLRIAPLRTPHIEGTGALYLSEGGDSDRVLLLTARHVALPPATDDNLLYEKKRRSHPPREIILLGSKAYTDAVDRAMSHIGTLVEVAKLQEEELAELETDGDDASTEARHELHRQIAETKRNMDDLTSLRADITTFWFSPRVRVLGRVLYAPPISIVHSEERLFTEDWALLDLDQAKFDWSRFQGNAIFLGIKDKKSMVAFAKKMHPHAASASPFKYPRDGLLNIRGTIQRDELTNPSELDANGEPCLVVVKNGMGTGVTVGRATGIESFVRRYPDHRIEETSMEVAVYSYNRHEGPFSGEGDSGSIVVDGRGRIAGMITGGANYDGYMDVTYLTPYYWLEERIQNAFPRAHLYPTVIE